MGAQVQAGCEEGPEQPPDPSGPAGPAGTVAGASRRGLGRGLGAILPARTAVPLELVGLGERSGPPCGTGGPPCGTGGDVAAQGAPEDRRRAGPPTIELRPPSLSRGHAALVAGIELALAEAGRSAGTVAVVVLGVDGFRHVNRAFGREAGDAVLQALGQRLLGSRRRGDLVGRIQGDEFAVVCTRVANALGARRAVERMIADLDAPLVVGGVEHLLRATFGLALDVAGEGTGSAPSMLWRARLAMQRAKEGGLRWAVFNPGRDGYQRPRWNTSSEVLRRRDVDDDGGSSPPGWPMRTAPT